MIIQKKELSQRIESIKSIVPKSGNMVAIQSILLKDGYLIATNHEITIKAKLEGTGSESFLIPQKAFDLIKNLPDGEMEISADSSNHSVTIKAGSINNTFQSLSPELFCTVKEPVCDNGLDISVDSEELREKMKDVLYAVAKKHSGKMGALCISCGEGYLNFAGTDGHMLAWDKLAFEGEGMELLIPRDTAEKLLQLDFVGEVKIKHSPTSAIFTTDDYIIETRLIDGSYVPYAKMFVDMPIHATVDKKKFMDAVHRAAMCIDLETRIPIRLQFDADSVRVYLEAKNAKYSETVPLDGKVEEPVLIAFDPRLLKETLKVFDVEKIHLGLKSDKQPMFVSAEGKELKSLVLPVNIKT